MHSFVLFIQAGLCFFHSFIPSWGFSIIAFTTALRVILAPLQVFSSKQQKILLVLKPQIELLQEKLKSDPRRLLSERVSLMKSAGAKPAWIFFASILQIPIFLAVYKAIRMNEQFSLIPFAWLHNLAAPDPYFVLPCLVAVVLWLQITRTKKAPVSGFKYLMPGLSFIFMATLPSAVVLYYLTGNILQLLGQKLIESYC